MPDLSQTEAEWLIGLEKRRVDDKEWNYPSLGGGISIPLVSFDEKEQFMLDIRRSRVNLLKGSYQNRARRIVSLIRLCFGGVSHHNPDGEEVGTPHIHIYREGYGDKWAYPLPGDEFTTLDSQWQVFQDFLRYCNITDSPHIRRGLTI